MDKIKLTYKNIEKPFEIFLDLPISKSYANRFLIINELSKSPLENPLILRDNPLPEDVNIMQNCISTIASNKGKTAEINVHDAGTVARFLISLLAITSGTWKLTSTERMSKRPIKELVSALISLGANIKYIEREGFLPLQIIGKELKGGSVTISAAISSQFISSLLMIAPLLKEGLIIKMKDNIVSKPYIDLSIKMMQHFGANVKFYNNTYIVEHSDYIISQPNIEFDWTCAASWYQTMLMLKNGNININKLNGKEIQEDKVLIKLYDSLGVITDIKKDNLLLRFSKKSNNNDFNFNLNNYPDLFPSLAVSLASKNISGKITGLSHLNYKESERLNNVVEQLSKNGFNVKKEKDTFICYSSSLSDKILSFNCYNDHRLIMAFACLIFDEDIHEINLYNYKGVEKSYPNFWNELKKINVITSKIGNLK